MSAPRGLSLLETPSGAGWWRITSHNLEWDSHIDGYRVRDTAKDAALVAAYTENVGHPPRNRAPMDDGYEQWHYNPRRPMYRGRADELARVPSSFGDCDECGTFGVDRDYTGADGRSVCDECRKAAA